MSLVGFVVPAVGANLLWYFVAATMLHALHGRNTAVVNPHQVSLAETSLFATLAAGGPIMRAVLIATAATRQIFFVARTIFDAA